MLFALRVGRSIDRGNDVRIAWLGAALEMAACAGFYLWRSLIGLFCLDRNSGDRAPPARDHSSCAWGFSKSPPIKDNLDVRALSPSSLKDFHGQRLTFGVHWTHGRVN
jgi:hypothetical protein